MKRKEDYIKVRVNKQTKELISRISDTENLDTSKLIRTMIHNYERPFTLSDSQLDMLKFHFTNTARLGGLLNQIAYHLNSDHLDIINGEKENMELDANELQKLCQKIEREVRDLKKSILIMCENKVA
tara:strand:- start:30973 stop:31353 length:381 start_codon:yes stop_codon:yes gene_type:complete